MKKLTTLKIQWPRDLVSNSNPRFAYFNRGIIVYSAFPVSTSRCIKHPLETLTFVSSLAKFEMSLGLLTVNRQKLD